MTKRISFLLVGLALAGIASAQQASKPMAAVSVAELPAEFRKATPFMQNQVCGELMASMARMSKDLFDVSGNAKVKEAAIMAGTRAMVFVKANANLTNEERTQARQIAQKIESGASEVKPTIKPFVYCEQRAQRWLQEGVVTAEDYRVTELEVRRAVDLAPVAKQR